MEVETRACAGLGDTNVMLEESRERLVISRVASDVSANDTKRYNVSLAPCRHGTYLCHLGETIRVKSRAPLRHSRNNSS